MPEVIDQLGAPAALKGYRVQALYTLKRILDQSENGIQFQPEGEEDLDVLDALGRPLELIQIKKYDSLKLSDLSPHSPESPGSFIGRAVRFLSSENQPAIKLVNFGAIGPEMRQAWVGDEAARGRIARKLNEGGFSTRQVDAVFANVELISLDETQEEGEVYRLLQEMSLGIDPNSAFDLLQHWLFTCMEQRRKITRADVIDRVSRVGQFLSERRDYQDQWYTTIQPLQYRPIAPDEHDRLQKEFYEGGFTRFEHILAGLDFYREEKVSAIKQGFQKRNVVIVHAASGQGKTALCYRYLQNWLPNNFRFAIRRIEGMQHALQIANALLGHANAIQAPMAIYVDVHPRDQAWPVLVEQLARHPYAQVLVAIREEDFNRADIAGAPFDFADVDLAFTEQEARLLFERAQASSKHIGFLDFESAWDAFNGSGPLLEFVYLLTQTTTLRQRLESQVNRIRDEVRGRNQSPDELNLLRLAAVANAYEARLNTRKLVASLSLPDPDRTLKSYKDEYLIRVSGTGRSQYIEGLHPIRSAILTDLLTNSDVNPWLEAAVAGLPLIEEEDLESFILHSLVDRPPQEYAGLLEAVVNLTPDSWAGLGGVLRALLWADIREYAKVNAPTFDAAREEFGPGWYILLDLNFSAGEGPNIGRWWADGPLADLFPRDRISRIEAICANQTPKENAFQISKRWLVALERSPSSPSTISDWTGVAEAIYWAKRFGIQTVGEWLGDDLLNDAVESVPLPVVAELSYALSLLNGDKHQKSQTHNRNALQSRLAREYNVISLDGDAELLTVHFLVPPTELYETEKDPLHAATIARIRLVRQLFPGYERYGSQGYGHRLHSFSLRHDSTLKTGIDKVQLVPRLATRINEIVIGIGRNRYRPAEWRVYIENVLDIRRHILTCLEQLRPGLSKYLERRNPVNVGAQYISKSDWQQCYTLLNVPPDLPQTAVDQWGFASESSSVVNPSEGQHRYIPRAIALRRYKSYLEAQNRYFSSCRNFVLQAVDVTATNFNLSKQPPTADRQSIVQALAEKGIKTDRGHLSTYNLWEATAVLEEYQQEFRRLFAHAVELEALDELEQNEAKLLFGIWCLWYFYAYEPQYIIPRALHKVPLKLQHEESRIGRLLQQALVNVRTENMGAAIIPTSLKWKESSTLWIGLDVKDPTLLYQAFEALLTSLQAVLAEIKPQDLAHYLIQRDYQYIVVIPTVLSRMMNNAVWAVSSITTILREGSINDKNWFLYAPQPLSPVITEQLELETWDIPQVEQANHLLVDFSSMWIAAGQVSELADLPSATDAGQQLLHDHISLLTQTFADHFQAFISRVRKLLAEFSSLPSAERNERPYLLKALSALGDILETIWPDYESGELTIDQGELAEYAR